MRVITVLLTSLAMMLVGATSALAFEVSSSARNSTTDLSPGDTVTIDVFFDATDVGIRLFSSSLTFDPLVFEYEDTTSNMLPIIYPAPPPLYGTNGGQPGYILYSPAGSGMPPPPATSLVPQQTPPAFPSWQLWVNPPPDLEQINFNYAEANITDTADTMVTGSNIWIASVVLRVVSEAPAGASDLTLRNDAGGNILQIGDTVLPSNGWTVTGPITVTVPEPASLALGLGALGVVAAITVRRRRRG